MIRYDHGFRSWALAIHDVRLIGEMTNDLGPFSDDYFYCFATDATSWWEASYYAPGACECIIDLAGRIDLTLSLALAGSTDYASNILWPSHVAGQPMFDFTAKQRSGILGKIADYFLPQNEQTFSDVARSVLDGSSPSCCNPMPS